jgi:hypothetical protein
MNTTEQVFLCLHNATQAAEKRSNTREFKAQSDYAIGSFLFQNTSERGTSFPDLLWPCWARFCKLE